MTYLVISFGLGVIIGWMIGDKIARKMQEEAEVYRFREQIEEFEEANGVSDQE